MIAAATVRALFSSQIRARSSTRVVQSRAASSASSAHARGYSATSVKNTH